MSMMSRLQNIESLRHTCARAYIVEWWWETEEAFYITKNNSQAHSQEREKKELQAQIVLNALWFSLVCFVFQSNSSNHSDRFGRVGIL